MRENRGRVLSWIDNLVTAAGYDWSISVHCTLFFLLCKYDWCPDED